MSPCLSAILSQVIVAVNAKVEDSEILNPADAKGIESKLPSILQPTVLEKVVPMEKLYKYLCNSPW
jgi:hypothetical protein